jgi:hypothetical protein
MKWLLAMVLFLGLAVSTQAAATYKSVTQTVVTGIVSGTWSYLTGCALPANRIYIRERTGVMGIRVSFTGSANTGGYYLTIPSSQMVPIDLNPATIADASGNTSLTGIYISTTSAVSPGSTIEYWSEYLWGW